LRATTNNSEPKSRRQVMKKTIKNIGLDVHKNSISIAIADDGRDGDVRYYGKIDNDMNQLDTDLVKNDLKPTVYFGHKYKI
jgi:hypothetical protein